MANLVFCTANLVVDPDHVVFYVVTIVWAFILADNFVWAYIVDPDREVAERAARRAGREARVVPTIHNGNEESSGEPDSKQ